MKRLFVAVIFAATVAGCSSVSPGKQWVRSEVYFGLSRPNGTLVAQADWQAFIDEVVTPKFPAGLTIVDTNGQWRNAHGVIDREASKMLVLLHPRSAEIETKIDEIRAEYCRRFDQEAVMKVTSRARVQF